MELNNNKWFRNATIYHIFIDRFAGEFTGSESKADFAGGTIRGIIDNLDYIEKLGMNTIWLSPFFKGTEYHGYHITDYFAVDERFGTEEDIVELVESVHARNMFIIADFVPNHCSAKHPFFLEAQNDKKADKTEWFHFTHWPNEYQSFLGFHELPKVKLENQSAREHLLNAAEKWLGVGFDGFRIDHAIGVHPSFWKYLKRMVRNEFPHAVLFGEVWVEGLKPKDFKTVYFKNKFLRRFFGLNQESIQMEYCKALDGVLDFHFQSLLKKYIADTDIFDTEALEKELHSHFSRYNSKSFLVCFLDNHDMNRFLYECGQLKFKLKNALKVLFAQKQPVALYYGTESGLSHTKDVKRDQPHADLEARKLMNWESVDKELYSFVQKEISKREDLKVKPV